MQKIFRQLSILVLIGVMLSTAFADTIRLKDGSIVKGKITGFSGGRFTVTIGEGQRRRTLTFEADEVESVEFDAVNTNAERSVAGNAGSNAQPASSRPASVPRVITTDTSTASVQKPPVIKSEPKVVRSDPPAEYPTVSSERASAVKPIELNVKVLADNTSNGWTNSGWVVKKGQRIKIIGDGEASLGNGQMTGPSGRYEIDDKGKLMQAVPTGALIAVIGDDNNDFIYIGSEREFTAERDGALFLGINEGNLEDNTGAFSVKVEIRPGI